MAHSFISAMQILSATNRLAKAYINRQKSGSPIIMRQKGRSNTLLVSLNKSVRRTKYHDKSCLSNTCDAQLLQIFGISSLFFVFSIIYLGLGFLLLDWVLTFLCSIKSFYIILIHLTYSTNSFY